MNLADLAQFGGVFLGGSAGAEGLRWLRGHGSSKADAAEKFMRMAMDLEEKYDQLRERFDKQTDRISGLTAQVSELKAQVSTQDSLLRESLHLIDELLDPSKPTPKMSTALRAAFEGLVGT